MNEMRFPRWLAVVGVLGGVAIALVPPLIALVYGSNLTGRGQLLIVVLALLVGGLVAGLAAVVGIALPTAIIGRGIKIPGGGVCCEPEGEDASCCAPPNEPSEDTP